VTLPVNFIDRFINSDKTSLLMIRTPFVVGGIPDDSQNKDVLKAKDIVVSIDGKPMKYLDEVKTYIDANKARTVPAVVLRDNKRTDVKVNINAEGKLGVALGALDENTLEKLGYYN